jgi:hypothetical protein
MDLVFRGPNRLLALNEDYPSHDLINSLTRWLRIGVVIAVQAKASKVEADPRPSHGSQGARRSSHMLQVLQ